MLQLVTSANVACGFHAGDPVGILQHLPARRCRATSSSAPRSATATWRGSAAGSWTSPGRDLKADVIYQIGALQALARSVGTSVHYVKPHGALYHAVNRTRSRRGPLVAAVLNNDSDLAVVGPPGSLFLSLAAGGRAAHGPRGLRRPGLRRRPARLLPRGVPGAADHRRGNRCSAGGSPGPDRQLSTRCACTRTRPVRSLWPRRPAGPCPRPGCRSPPSPLTRRWMPGSTSPPSRDPDADGVRRARPARRGRDRRGGWPAGPPQCVRPRTRTSSTSCPAARSVLLHLSARLAPARGGSAGLRAGRRCPPDDRAAGDELLVPVTLRRAGPGRGGRQTGLTADEVVAGTSAVRVAGGLRRLRARASATWSAATPGWRASAAGAPDPGPGGVGGAGGGLLRGLPAGPRPAAGS